VGGGVVPECWSGPCVGSRPIVVEGLGEEVVGVTEPTTRTYFGATVRASTLWAETMRSCRT